MTHRLTEKEMRPMNEKLTVFDVCMGWEKENDFFSCVHHVKINSIFKGTHFFVKWHYYFMLNLETFLRPRWQKMYFQKKTSHVFRMFDFALFFMKKNSITFKKKQVPI